MKATRSLARVKLLGAILMATCLFVAAANAEPFYKGKFTLPYEVKWGKAVLPPGDYALTLNPGDVGGNITIRTASGKGVGFVMPVGVSDGTTKAPSALRIAVAGRDKVVYSLRLAELGVDLVFEPRLARLAQARELAEKSDNTREVPLFYAKN